MLALALWSVNAIACAPAKFFPVREGRAWTDYLGVPSRAPSAAQVLAAQPSVQWVTEIGRAAAGPIALGDSVILVQAVDQTLSAVARADGERRWRNRLDGPGASGPLLAWDHVYAATGGPDGKVYSLALVDGHEQWSRTVGPVVGPIATQGPAVFVALEHGLVVALETEHGAVKWRVGLRGPIRAGLTLVNHEIIVATDDSLFALHPDSGRRVRVTALPSILAPPALYGDTMIFVTPRGEAIALTAHDFAPAWRVTLGPSWGNAAVARDTLFVVTMNGVLWRVPLADPTHPLQTPVGNSIRAGPAPIAGGVLIATVAGDILRFGADSVATWRERIDGPIEQPPLVDRGSLIVVDGHGRIHLWR